MGDSKDEEEHSQTEASDSLIFRNLENFTAKNENESAVSLKLIFLYSRLPFVVYYSRLLWQQLLKPIHPAFSTFAS